MTLVLAEKYLTIAIVRRRVRLINLMKRTRRQVEERKAGEMDLISKQCRAKLMLMERQERAYLKRYVL